MDRQTHFLMHIPHSRFAGLINDFLSWGVWASIAKISFMTYLFHMGPNFDFFAAMGYNVDVSMWLFTEVFVAQLFVDLFYGLLGCLFLELPFGKVQKILIEYILSIKSIKIITVEEDMLIGSART